MSALVTAEEAQALLDDYAAGLMPDGRAYAPILGASVPASASLRDLIGAVEKAFGDGFKCTSTRPIGGGR